MMAHEPERQPEMPPDQEPETGSSGAEDLAGSASRLTQPPAGLIGQTLGGRYRFDELLGEGSFARVFRVYDLHRRVSLAAKVLRSDIAQEPAFLERFRREAKVLARLQHPHIVRYYEIIEVDNTVFILTDYIPGRTMQAVLRDLKKPMSPFESLAYLTPLAAALHYAHQEGIVHRDLKPANILIDANSKLYVTDFGIARILSDTSTLTLDMSVGTPHYMSPEQILSGQITPATDIYALGVLLYQMYTRQLPFRGESADAQGTTTAIRIAYEHLHVKPEPPTALNPRLSAAVERVILRCLEKDPSQRYASVSDLYDALADAIGTPSVSLESGELAGVRAQPEPAAEAEPSGVRPAAEPVPAGVGGESKIVPEEEYAPDWSEPPKRKRKPKPAPAAPPEGEKQGEKDRDDQEKQNEKDRENEEKKEEKETEKGEEKGEFMSNLAPSDRLSRITWGGIVLWAGIVFLAQETGPFRHLVNNPAPWLLGGAGALVLVEVAARLAIPELRARPGARLVLGVVLLMVGLGIGIGLSTLWPLILIAIGISLFLNRLID